MDSEDVGQVAVPAARGVADQLSGAPHGPLGTDGRTGPTWCRWPISILVAVILAVAATLIFGGANAWRAPVAGRSGAGAGACCASGDR